MVRLTQQDIDNGLKGLCRYCPVALATERAYPGSTVNVAATTVAIRVGDEVTFYTLPQEVCHFIKDFDAGEEVSPLEFELEAQCSSDTTATAT